MKKTIVELDLKGYSDVARDLEEHFSAELVLKFNEQIQSFVNDGLKVAGVAREGTVMATTGDGAILVFEIPSVAHVFAEAVHHASRLHNHSRTLPAAQRWFRIGLATGDLAEKEAAGKKEIAGSVIARAVRLEAAGNVGEILADADTYARLSPEQRACYGPEESIAGKRDEKFRVHRYKVIPGPATPPTTSPLVTPSAKPSAALRKWQERLDFLLAESAIVASPAQKFELKCLIAEAREKIAELGG